MSDALTRTERARVEQTRGYIADVTSGQIGGALRQRLVELLAIIDRTSPPPSTGSNTL